MYFNVNFNVLNQIHCALVGVIKRWDKSNARYNCENYLPTTLFPSLERPCFNPHVCTYVGVCKIPYDK